VSREVKKFIKLAEEEKVTRLVRGEKRKREQTVA